MFFGHHILGAHIGIVVSQTAWICHWFSIERMKGVKGGEGGGGGAGVEGVSAALSLMMNGFF